MLRFQGFSMPPARVVLCGALVIFHASSAFAAGMFLAPRGVRPLARGGAFVAGADDVNALTYNPAGISDTQSSVLLDMALPLHKTDYQRTVNGSTAGYPAVEGQGLSLPIPTLGATFRFDALPQLGFGVGVSANYPLVQNWPDELEDGSAAPQRYAIENYDGTAMVKVGTGVGYRYNEVIAVGATFQLLAGNFASQVRASACPGGPVCSQPENPDFDTVVQMISNGMIIPGVQLGMLVRPTSWLQLGASWETGYTIDRPAEFHVRLPAAGIYSDAYLDPETPKGRVSFKLPQTVMAGAEVRVEDMLRVEASFVWENWAAHDQVAIDMGDLQIRNVTGMPDYEMEPLPIERGFRNTWSIRLGGEYTPRLQKLRSLTLRGGLMYEPSAVPDDYLTPMSVDLDKVIVSAGAAYDINETWHLEATYAHVFMDDTTVTNSQVLQTNATRPPPENRTAIGNGSYASSANILGVGLKMRM